MKDQDKLNQLNKELIIAAECGDIEKVKSLLKQGADVNFVDDYGNTPLIIASQKGRSKVVQLLLTKKEINVNLADKNGLTPIIIASCLGNLEVVRLLLAKKEIDVNLADDKG